MLQQPLSRVKPFTNFFLILGAVASLAIIPSATGAPPFVSIFYPSEETAIQPGSIISGYPIPPAYTLTRYDEDYSYLANPANRTDPPDVIKYIPLETFNPMFPAGYYYGGPLNEQIGPKNAIIFIGAGS